MGNLTFKGPCIVIYFYSKTTEMHQFLKFILFWNNTVRFRRSFRPSSGFQDCTYSNRYMSNRYCYLLAVCTVLNSRWWTERPSETCRVLFQSKINLRNWCIQLVLL